LVTYILAETSRQEALALPTRLVNGHDLTSALGVPPGPLVGELLAAVAESQATGEIHTREDALQLARALLEKHHEE
jgi:hypothetical protein